MSEHERSAARAVYDHEVDEPHLAGRRRAVADWGVGEEIFDHMPRRRFRGSESQRRDHHPRERRSRVEPVAAESREHRFEPAPEEPRERRFEPASVEPRERRFEPAVQEPPVTEPPAADLEPIPPIDLTSDPTAERPPEGRRTVVIRGRGAEPSWTPRARPPRTVGERIGPRPDRLAAWAVALGMLLILIAILTAHG
jgi:hypothetical protein